MCTQDNPIEKKTEKSHSSRANNLMSNDEIVKKKFNFIKKFKKNKFKSIMVNYNMRLRQLNKKDNKTNNEVKDLLTKCQMMNLKIYIYI
jgi:hypothetical protein